MAVTLPAYLLCGGASRRFGSDKARQLIAGREMILCVADVYRGQEMPVVAVAREQGVYDDLGITTIADIVPSRGPIAGIVTALTDWTDRRERNQDNWVLVSACDWVGLDPEWIEQLVEHAGPDDQVVLFRSRYAETLFALYHISARQHLRDCIDGGELALHQVIRKLNCRELDCPPGWENVVNANRPGDLE